MYRPHAQRLRRITATATISLLAGVATYATAPTLASSPNSTHSATPVLAASATKAPSTAATQPPTPTTPTPTSLVPASTTNPTANSYHDDSRSQGTFGDDASLSEANSASYDN